MSAVDEEPDENETLPFHAMTAVDEELDENETLLIYPFVGGLSVEECVSGLDLCVVHSPCDAALLTMLQLEKSAAWENLLTITVHDLNSLADECCVNDCVLQFWFQWLFRFISLPTSNVHFFNSFFYSQLYSFTQCYIHKQVVVSVKCGKHLTKAVGQNSWEKGDSCRYVRHYISMTMKMKMD
jgi:hypothetical protein